MEEGTGDSIGVAEEVYGQDQVRVKSLTLEDMKNNFATPERVGAKGCKGYRKRASGKKK